MLYKEAAEMGNVSAMFNTAVYYENGLGSKLFDTIYGNNIVCMCWFIDEVNRFICNCKIFSK